MKTGTSLPTKYYIARSTNGAGDIVFDKYPYLQLYTRKPEIANIIYFRKSLSVKISIFAER